MNISPESFASLITKALSEDIGAGDLTSQATISESHHSGGWMIAKDCGVISGLQVAGAVFERVDAEIVFSPAVADGDSRQPGERIARVKGPTRSILTAERTALNFLQHLSGIATSTARFVDRVRPRDVRILDTRKTIPGLRLLEKAAVIDGGGVNHRMGLFDAVMIKDNHLDAAGGIDRLFAGFAKSFPQGLAVPVIVEVRNLVELRSALPHPIDRVLLDNFTPALVAEAVEIVAVTDSPSGKRLEIEISGGITLDTIADYALPGVDYISVGSLTHSAPALDISLTLNSGDDVDG